MDSVVEEGAIWSAVHDLRDLIKPLHVRIKHTKGLGYRLEAKSD
jgi:DNA-binding response OmpR family regulator